jgi:acyl carrier protein
MATTNDEIYTFLLDSLREMNYDTSSFEQDTAFGPAGADLESRARAQLAGRVEDRFGVRFDDDEAEMLAGMTFGELAATVAGRLQPAPAPGV